MLAQQFILNVRNLSIFDYYCMTSYASLHDLCALHLHFYLYIMLVFVVVDNASVFLHKQVHYI